MDQAKFLEESLGRPYHFKFFKGCLPQILLGPFLNTLSHVKMAAFRLIPYACSFATSRSCGIQSKALDTSINKAPVKTPLSKDSFQFSINLFKTWHEL